MEQANTEYFEWPSISPEVQAIHSEALLKWDMESIDAIAEDGNLEQTRDIVSSLASSNPLFASALHLKQSQIWEALVSQMQSMNLPQIMEQAWEKIQSLWALWEYFWINDLVSIHEELTTDGLNLDISQYLSGYKDYIENDLAELQPEIKNKIIASIWIRISKIWDIVQKIKKNNPEDIAGQRWILNVKIQDNLWEINNKILPSAFMLQEYSKAESREVFIENTIASMEFEEYELPASDMIPSRTVTIEERQNIVRGMLGRNISEAQEMFNAPVDTKSWEFDELGFNGMAQIDTLQVNMGWHMKRFEAMGWDISTIREITMLSEADQAIQSDAMVAYLITVLSQLIPYAGAVTSVPADLTSTLTNQDGVMKWLKASGIVPKEFHMEEFPAEWLIWLISLWATAFWVQGLVKAGKLWKVWKVIGRIKPSVLMKSFADMWEKMGIGPDTMKKIKEMLFGKVEDTKNLDLSADDIDRLDKAVSVLNLWRDLKDVEKKAIIKAHRIWERWEDGLYPISDISKKVKTLKQGGFDNTDIRKLLDNNICGSETIKSRILELDLSIDKLEQIPWFVKIFDKDKWFIIKESISHEEVLKLVSWNKLLKELFSIYTAKNWKVIDPDAFREIFIKYKWFNSSEFDEIVQKLSKIHYRLLLLGIEWDINSRIRLIWGAPGSWKSSAGKVVENSRNRQADITFDSPLSDIRFIDYLQNEANKANIHNIDIDMIHRDPIQARESIVKRAIETGRPVWVSYYKETYKKVRNVMNELNSRDVPNINYVDNSRGIWEARIVWIEEINKTPENLDSWELSIIVKNIIEKKQETLIIEGGKNEEIERLLKLQEALLK